MFSRMPSELAGLLTCCCSLGCLFLPTDYVLRYAQPDDLGRRQQKGSSDDDDTKAEGAAAEEESEGFLSSSEDEDEDMA